MHRRSWPLRWFERQFGNSIDQNDDRERQVDDSQISKARLGLQKADQPRSPIIAPHSKIGEASSLNGATGSLSPLPVEIYLMAAKNW